MNELNNIVTSTGNYNNIPTTLTSNISVVSIKDSLTITKSADKQNWSSGNLTYTITIKNQTNIAYQGLVITEVLNNSLIYFASNSITINNIPAKQSQYNYNDNTHTLAILLNEVATQSTTIITFIVKKKYNKPFKLISYCILHYSDGKELKSNKVTVISPYTVPYPHNLDCSAPFWRS